MKIPRTTEDELRNAGDAIEIELTHGAAVRLPRAIIEEFRGVPPAGYGIKLDQHDISISVHHGLIGSLTTAGDMAASLGKLGGAARADAKPC